MFLQTDPMFNYEIGKYGCYFMDIPFVVSKKTGRGFDRADIMHIYDQLTGPDRPGDWMTKNCFLEDSPKVFTFLGLPVESVEMCDPSVECKPGQFEFLRFERTFWSQKQRKLKTYGHFTCGNGEGIVTYDPAGNSNAVKYGHLESKRIFTRSK